MIPFGAVSDLDIEEMGVGDFFRMRVGYELPRSEGKDPVLQIIFAERVPITEADLEKGRKWALEMEPFLRERE